MSISRFYPDFHPQHQDTGILMPIGGAEDRTTQSLILRHFVQLCGGADARLVVIPTASSFASQTGGTYCNLFGQLGVDHVICLHVTDRHQANDPANVALLDRATGIFISGGDQLKLLSLLGGTRLAEAIRARFAEGVHVAGTSAGASAMSRHMIAFGRSGMIPSQRMVQLASGLGLSDSLIIDQHFTQRSRLGRLLTAIALNPGMVGVGVDENTAFLIKPNGDCEVIGAGTVTIVDGRELTYTDIHTVKRYDAVTVEGARVHVLKPGQHIDLSADFDDRLESTA